MSNFPGWPLRGRQLRTRYRNGKRYRYHDPHGERASTSCKIRVAKQAQRALPVARLCHQAIAIPRHPGHVARLPARIGSEQE